MSDNAELSTRVENALDYKGAEVLTESIREDLKIAAQHFLSAGEKLAIVFERRGWEPLSRTSWTEYCELDLHISDALAYDLIRLANLRAQFPQMEAQMLNVGISKLRLLLPQLPQEPTTKAFRVTPEAIQEQLETAETLTWKDLRDTLKGGTGYERIQDGADLTCPHCQWVIRVTRATTPLQVRPPKVA